MSLLDLTALTEAAQVNFASPAPAMAQAPIVLMLEEQYDVLEDAILVAKFQTMEEHVVLAHEIMEESTLFALDQVMAASDDELDAILG